MNGLNYQEEAQVYRELDKKGAKIKRLEAEIARLKQQLLEVTAERDALQKSVARIMRPIETIQPRGITE